MVFILYLEKHWEKHGCTKRSPINILEEVISGGARLRRLKTIIFHQLCVNSVWQKGFCIVVPIKRFVTESYKEILLLCSCINNQWRRTHVELSSSHKGLFIMCWHTNTGGIKIVWPPPMYWAQMLLQTMYNIHYFLGFFHPRIIKWYKSSIPYYIGGDDAVNDHIINYISTYLYNVRQYRYLFGSDYRIM